MHTLITKLIKIDLQQLALPIAGLLTAIVLQGCIHVQQPKSNTDISIYQPKVSELQYSKNKQSKPQIIGLFSISTHSKGAFLESVQFRPSAINNAFTQVRVKLVGDDQWFTPSEVNIFLEPQQLHHFEVAARINPNKLSASLPNSATFTLSDFHFLKSDATSSVNQSILSYSLGLSSSPQQSRS